MMLSILQRRTACAAPLQQDQCSVVIVYRQSTSPSTPVQRHFSGLLLGDGVSHGKGRPDSPPQRSICLDQL